MTFSSHFGESATAKLHLQKVVLTCIEKGYNRIASELENGDKRFDGQK